jgi:hypothetical protein
VVLGIATTASRDRPRFGRPRRGPVGRAVGVALAVLVVAACGSGQSPVAGGTPAKVTTTSSTLPPDRTAVLAAWRHYWDVYIAVGEQMQLPDPRLAQVAAGQELQTLGGAFLAAKSEGEVLRGSVDLDPKVISIGNGTASLRDCYLSDVLGYKDNKPVGPADPQRRLVAATLVLAGGAWKVSSIDHISDGCTAS